MLQGGKSSQVKPTWLPSGQNDTQKVSVIWKIGGKYNPSPICIINIQYKILLKSYLQQNTIQKIYSTYPPMVQSYYDHCDANRNNYLKTSLQITIKDYLKNIKILKFPNC